INVSAAEFLGGTAEIRRAIHKLTIPAKSLDLAVAFIGPEWQRLLANYSGTIRTVCWLKHPATDPDAVQAMMKRSGAEVKQRDGLHTKVYIAPGVGAVVGSANLSQPALTERGNSTQCEAAVVLTNQRLVRVVSEWFEALWRDQRRTKPITRENLEEAKKERKKWPFRAHTTNPVPPLPDVLPPLMVKLAAKIGKVSLYKELHEYHKFISGLSPETLSRSDVVGIVNYLTKWAKRRGAFRNFERQSLVKLRKGFVVLFDEGRDILTRLEQIEREGLMKGLRIRGISMLLYWWNPEQYPPFNAKTEKFLKGFRRASRGMSASSPACYVTWIEYAVLLQTRLHLGSVGHVDRLVAAYYDWQKDKSKPRRSGARA
ncbi:MAG: phospholipase D-like domain-containing protein, partial [Terriglobia bacterium]